VLVVNVRRLAAVDLSGLGPKIIIPEFALAVLGAPALGVLTLLRSTTTAMTILGVSLVGLGVNYVPLLVHAIDLVRRSAVMAEIAREASEPRVLYAKYRR
jgi:hypothetical protein